MRRDLKAPTWPHLPLITVLVDRADGTDWYITHRRSDDRIGINSGAVPRFHAGEVRRFPAYEEPYLPTNPTLRIFVRGGRLGYEVVPLERGVTDRDSGRVYTRLVPPGAAVVYGLHITDGGWAAEGDPLGWEVAFGEASL